MSNKFCAVCGAENKEHFTYCKQCGAFLPVVEKMPRAEAPSYEKKHTFGDITYAEYSRYIKSGADGILFEFEKLDKGSRFAFSLPALFLGLVFGFYGLAAWFFYRNLKKIGFILLMIGAFFTLADALVNYSLVRSLVDGLSGVFLYGGFDSSRALQQLINVIYSYSVSFVGIFKHIGFFASFFVSAVCLKIYKKSSALEITKAKEYCAATGAPFDFVVKQIGGTNVALAAIPFIVYLFFPIICLTVGFI